MRIFYKSFTTQFEEILIKVRHTKQQQPQQQICFVQLFWKHFYFLQLHSNITWFILEKRSFKKRTKNGLCSRFSLARPPLFRLLLEAKLVVELKFASFKAHIFHLDGWWGKMAVFSCCCHEKLESYIMTKRNGFLSPMG